MPNRKKLCYTQTNPQLSHTCRKICG